jgi:hypothetical protein
MRVEGSIAWYELLRPQERVFGWILLYASSVKDPIEDTNGIICELWQMICRLPKPRADMFSAVGFCIPCPRHCALSMYFLGRYGKQYQELENQRLALCCQEPHRIFSDSADVAYFPSHSHQFGLSSDIHKWLFLSDAQGPLWEQKQRSQLRPVPKADGWTVCCESFIWVWKGRST